MSKISGGYLLEKDICLEESHMDKGFNDDELADIMNEIESLEKEFTEDVSVSVEDPIAEEMNEALEAVSDEGDTEEVVVEEPIAEEVVAVEVSEDEVAEDEVSMMEEFDSEEFVVEAEETIHAEQENDIVPSAALTQPIHSVEVDSEMEGVLSELSEMPVEEVVSKHEAHDDNIHHISHSDIATPKAAVTKGGHSSMSFNVEGDMKLDLAFNISGKVVQLHISENGFELELEGGIKFSIPLDEAHSNKKAA
jgi:hypothetical protein